MQWHCTHLDIFELPLILCEPPYLRKSGARDYFEVLRDAFGDGRLELDLGKVGRRHREDVFEVRRVLVD